MSKDEKPDMSIQRKRECFNKSKEAVSTLLECNISESFLLEQIKYLTQSDYQDVTEERAISKICGYAICDNKLGHIPAKKYHISTVSNKVYDITERKNYCSNRCCKASLYLKEQILISSVWLREGEDFSNIHLLSTTSKADGLPGEVTLGLEKLTIDESKPKQETSAIRAVSSYAFSALEELQEIGGSSYESLIIKEQTSSKDNDLSHVTPEKSLKVKFEAQKEKEVQQKETNSSETVLLKNPTCSKNIASHSSLQSTSPVLNVEISDTTNVTNIPNVQLTSSFITNDLSQSVKKSINSLPKKVCNAAPTSASYMKKEKNSIPEEKTLRTDVVSEDVIRAKASHQSWFKVPKKESTAEKEKINIIKVNKTIEEWFTLNTLFYLVGFDKLLQTVTMKIEKLETSNEEINVLEIKEKLLELCNDLKEKHSSEHHKIQLNDLELKVKAFYEGKTVIRSESTIQVTRTIPPVDKYNQRLLRHKIVWDKLSKIVPELLEILSIPEDIFAESRGLTETFNFGAHNVMLKPNEWNLIGLIIIKILSEKLPSLKTGLASKKISKRLVKMLHTLNLESNYLDDIVQNLFSLKTINV